MGRRKTFNKPSQAGQMAKDTLRRFPDLPKMTLANYLIKVHGDLYDDDIEKARAKLRYWAGKSGKKDRGRGEKIPDDDRPTMPRSRAPVRTPYTLPHGTWLVLADAHVPYHSQRAVESAIQHGQASGVDGVLLNGDVQDCKALSFWPDIDRRSFPREVEAMIDFLDFLQGEFSGARFVYKPGNHEDRVDQYYASNAPELIGLPTAQLETVLGLEARAIEFLGRKQLINAGELPIFHGHELRMVSTVVNPARGLFQRCKHSAMGAHHHRSSEHNESDVTGRLHTTWSLGCLCDLKPDYNPECNNWNHGFAILSVEKDGSFEVENRRILPNGKVV